MPAPSHVQDNWAEGTNVSSLAVTLSSVASGADVTAGNTLLCTAAYIGSGNRTIGTFSDDNSNTWNKDEDLGNTTYTRAIGSADNVNSGATVITVAFSSFTGNLAIAAVEISGADSTDAYDTSDSFHDTDTSDANHYCATSPGIGTAANVFLVAVDGVAVGAVSSYAAPSGWTMIRSSTSFGTRGYAHAYISSASALSNERAVFTQTGTNRASKGAVASYDDGGGGGATTSVIPLLVQMGAY